MDQPNSRHLVTSGRGVVQVRADEAVVSAWISARDSNRAVVVKRVGEEAARLRAALDEIGHASLATSALSVEAVREAKKGYVGQGSVIAYLARQTFTIHEQDFTRLQATLSLLASWRAASGVAAELSRVSWNLTPDGSSEASARAAALAFRDAQRRAAAIAVAAGVALPSVPAFIREGAVPGQYGVPAPAMFAAARAAPPGEPAEETIPITVEPPEIEISTSVTAGWEIAPDAANAR